MKLIEKGGRAMIEVSAIDVPSVPKDSPLYVTLFDDIIKIEHVKQKAAPITLQNAQITNIQRLSGNEVIEQEKSVIGRGVIGAAAGPIGAIIGAMSGLKDKKIIIKKNFIIIGYKEKDSENLNSLIFEETGSKLMTNAFILNARNKINTEAVEL